MGQNTNNITRILCAGALLFFAVGVHAQQGVLTERITLTSSPTYPKPHETVQIEMRPLTFNPETTTITWRVNGSTVQSGVGITSINTTLGGVGVPTTVSVTVNPSETRRVEGTLTVWPTSLDMLWYATTYTPPGYRGKALPVRGSNVAVTVLPSFAGESGGINPASLIYDWEVDGQLRRSESGRGKNTLVFPITKSKNAPPRVSVRVSDAENVVVQQSSLIIPVFEPQALLYEFHPLEGPLFQNALMGSYRLASGDQVQVLAVPYFASAAPPFLDFIWRVGLQLLSPSEAPDILSYRADPGSAAIQTVELEIQNPRYILERIQTSFRMSVQ